MKNKNNLIQSPDALLELIKKGMHNEHAENVKNILESYCHIMNSIGHINNIGVNNPNLGVIIELRMEIYRVFKRYLNSKDHYESIYNFVFAQNDGEYFFDLVNFLIESKQTQKLHLLLKKTKESNYFESLDFNSFNRYPNYYTTLSPLVDFLIENGELEMIKIIRDLNEQNEYFGFNDLRSTLSRFYLQSGEINETVDYINSYLKNSDWSSDEEIRRIIMTLYNVYKHTGLLESSYLNLKNSIRESGIDGIYDLFRCLFNTGDKYSYTIIDDKLNDEIIHFATAQFSKLLCKNRNEKISNYADLEAEVSVLVSKVVGRITSDEFMNYFTHLGDNLSEAGDGSIYAIMEGLTGDLPRLNFINENYDSNSPDIYEIQHEKNIIVSTEDKLQFFISLIDQLEFVITFNTEDRNTFEKLKFYVQDYSNAAENLGYGFGEDDGYTDHLILQEVTKKWEIIEEMVTIYPHLFSEFVPLKRLGHIRHYINHTHPNDINEEAFSSLMERYYKDLEKVEEFLDQKINYVKKYGPEFNSTLLYRYLNHHIKWLVHQLGQEKSKERDRIFADISHRIKNVIQSIQTPLVEIEEWIEEKQQIKNAIKGTQIISNIVNLASYLYSAKIEDFYHDAKNNKGGKSLELIIIDSIKSAIIQMFDGKYFNRENRNYFKTIEAHTKAQKDFNNKIINSSQVNEIINYIEKHFFKIKIDFTNINRCLFGDDRKTPIKLSSIFVELFLNAVKNLSYLNKEQRELIVKVDFDKELKFSITNSFSTKRMIMATGFGLDSIKNMLEEICSITISKDNPFNVTLIFPDLWKGD